MPSPNEDFTVHLKRGVRGLRLGIVEDFTFRNVNPEVAQAVQAALDMLANLGADIKTVPIPLLSGKIDFRYPLTILLYEFNQIFGDTYRAEPNKDLFGPVVQANIAQGEQLTQETYDAALNRRPSEIAEIRQVFRDVDAFITPTHPIVAPPLTVNAEGDASVRQFTGADQLYRVSSHLHPMWFQFHRAPDRFANRGERLSGTVTVQDRLCLRTGHRFSQTAPPALRR